MAEFSFEIEEKLLVLSENDKGVQTIPRWARGLPSATKNSKFSLTPSKTKTRSAWRWPYFV